MSRVRDEEGFTLVEVLVAATIMLIVLMATMSVLEASTRQQRLLEQHNEAQQNARTSLDDMARELRNLASPNGDPTVTGFTLPGSVKRNLPQDLIFQSVGETKTAGSLNQTNVMNVRYCLRASDGSLWRQTQTWTTAAQQPVPADTSCPGAGWNPGDTVVASSVANVTADATRPIFRYAGDAGAITATDEDSRKDIARVRADLFIDPTPGTAPREAHLATALFLRNQNREPIARFEVLALPGGVIDLNGSSSEDPEGQLLTYQFYVDPPSTLPDCELTPLPPSCIPLSAARVQYPTPDTNPHTYVLRVTDPSGLTGIATKSFQYPPPTTP